MKSAIVLGVIFAGGIALVARGQSTVRPGEPTQSRVWVENHAPADAIPVIVQSVATPVTTHLDSTSTVQTIAARQTWEYRSVQLAAGADATAFNAGIGSQGWEAVGVLQSGAGGATVLFKRPR